MCSMSRKELSATNSASYGTRLSLIKDSDDIPQRWRGTPIEEFIGAHNFDKPIEGGGNPRLLIVSCIEYRFSPQIPHTFAYVMRTAGGSLRNLDFPLAYILAKGVRHVALVAHNDCGMTKVPLFKPNLINALVEQGWDEDRAKNLIESQSDAYFMPDEIDGLKNEYEQLRDKFNSIEIAPLFVSIASTRFHIPKWFLQ